ncbi:MAG TPA: hypothetical protein VL400_02605 [Polyangiaceae bacterium]|nr:hypothetical protein [Polyangiaceae bacterium]
MVSRLGLGALVLVGAVAASGVARAQAIARAQAAPRAEADGRERLMSRFGIAAGRRLVDDPSPDERKRGLERLAAIGTPEAIEALIGAMDSGSPLARDPELRLHAVRLLSKFADRDEVRSYLVRELMDAAGRRDAAGGFPGLLRDTAALALAREGGEQSLAALVSAAALRGPAGDSARQALVIAPPPSLDPLLYESNDAGDEDDEPAAREGDDDERVTADGADKSRAKSSKKKDASKKKRDKAKPKTAAKEPAAEPVTSDEDAADADETPGDERPAHGAKTPRLLTPLTMTLLGDLGDLRAIPALRGELDRSDRGARAAAGLALAKLGDGAAGDAAAEWAKEKDPKLVAAAAEILVTMGRAEAPRVVKQVLAEDATRATGVRLAFDLASPELASGLDGALGSLEPKDAARAVVGMGRAGEVKRLLGRLGDPTLGPSAMTALAQSPGEGAVAAISAGLAGKDARRFGRVAIARALMTGERVSGLDEALARLRVSKDAADRETAALGLVALGDETPASLLGDGPKPDRALLVGAARGALARPTDEVLSGFEPVLAALDPEKPSLDAVAAGVALLSPAVADRVPRATLLRLAENGGPLAALAARALPRRDDGTITARIDALLAGSDPSVRVATAIGLADGAVDAAASKLGRAYLGEDDVRVRRALVWALARRDEPQRARYLDWAAALDPDRAVRSMARAGKRGGSIPALTGVAPAAHVALVTKVAAVGDAASMQPLRVVLASGLALPVVSASDGGLVVPGVPLGRATVELAPGAPTVDSASP